MFFLLLLMTQPYNVTAEAGQLPQYQLGLAFSAGCPLAALVS